MLKRIRRIIEWFKENLNADYKEVYGIGEE